MSEKMTNQKRDTDDYHALYKPAPAPQPADKEGDNPED